MLSLFDIFQKVHDMKKNVFIRNNLRIGKEQGLISEHQLAYLNQLEAMNLVDYEIGLYTLAQESLLGRGRNHIAAVAIRQGWDKLFFIDADARFTWDQFRSVLHAPYDIVAGACPVKVLPISLNYLPFQDDEHFYKDRIRSVDSLLKMREGHKSQFVPVGFIGTAFMCLSRKLLLACAAETEEYQYPNPATGHLHTHWDMFDTKPMYKKYMSEDWSMCERARKLGFPVMLDTNVIISHVGSMVYTPEMAQITHIPKQDGVFTDGIGA
jgi:hypothetical protein